MKHTCIIAEAGVNHNGSIAIAKEMVKCAKEAGADYIKFQTFVPEQIVSRFAQKADYQKTVTDEDESQLEMLKKLSLTYDEFVELKQYCDLVGIGFVSTPFDFDSIEFLKKLNMDFWKIPSGEITNLPYLELIGQTGLKAILSTGMSTMEEIKKAIDILEQNGTKEIILLHCNTQYPTPMRDVNLNAMLEIKLATGKEVGYSDHTQGIEVPIAAVALGAAVIEKHFTLDKSMGGPDHKASLDPNELRSMVSAIRNIETALGEKEKKPSASERQNINVARKSITAKKEIKTGEIFSKENLTVKRPGSGVSPMMWYKVLGTKAKRDYSEDEMIEI